VSSGVRPGGRIALIAALALLVLPAAASAYSGATKTGGRILVSSDPGERNKILVGFNLSLFSWSIEDTRGMIPTLPCTAASPNVALCPVSGDDRLDIRPGDSKDSVFFSPLIGDLFPGTTRIVSVRAGPGDDFIAMPGLAGTRLLGGPGADRLLTSFGNDSLSGGPGDDLLEPGGGRDVLLGGPGRDRIRARDFTRDLRISCGPGRDRLSRDRFDPSPSGCP
jgi:Ca2+-binding RTX toxin-like protein